MNEIQCDYGVLPMKNRLLLILIIMGLINSSCSSSSRLYRKANKHYQNGLFEVSVQEAANSLRKKPYNAKAQDLLVQAWEKTIKTREDRINKLKQSSDPNKWEQIMNEYIALQELGSSLQTLPTLVNPYSGYRVLINIPDLSEKISSSRDNAAEDRYQAGIRYAKISNDIETQKKAALEFKASMNLIPDYKDASLRYDQCRKQAIKRIAITPFEDKSNSRNRYGAIADLLTDHIISQIISFTANSDFVEIIARSQMDAVMAEQQLSASGLVSEASTVRLGQILGAHEILTGRILQVSVTPSRTVSVAQETKARVVIGREDYIDEDGKNRQRDVHGEVSCQYRKYTKTAGVNVSGSFSIIDVETGKLKLQESMEIKNPWADSWCRKISGDDRALNPNLKTQIVKTEPFPPEDGEMVMDALRQLGSAIVSKTRSYLN